MPKSIAISRVLQALEGKAPSHTAESWDNVGLMAGDPSWTTSGAVISVDLTREALQTAKKRKAGLIVTHHPCLFPRGKGLSRLVPGEIDALSTLIFEAVREGIALVSCHTNFDRCALEVVESVSKGLGALPKGRLFDRSEKGELVKLSVFVPQGHLAQVRDAVCAAGAGQIGNYDSCTFVTEGIGTFRGSEGTRPFLGKPGRLEQAEEVRLETVLPRGLESTVLRALRESHPYEEVAYDLYPVEQRPPEKGLVKGLGYGFWGDFERSLSFSDFAKRVRSVFGVKGFLMAGSAPRRVSRIAFSAGKGSSFLSHAASLDCDVMITGETGYHPAIESSRSGMAVIELGHTQSEIFFPRVMSSWLSSSKVGLKTTSVFSPIQRLLC